MKKEVKIIAGIIMLIALGSLALTYGQGAISSGGHGGPEGHRGGPGGPGGAGVYFRLNLTDDQKTQIQAVLTASRTASEQYFTDAHTAEEQLEALVRSGSFTREAALPITKAKAEAMAQADMIRAAADAQIFSLLTADQKAQLATLKAQRPSFPPGDGAKRNQGH